MFISGCTQGMPFSGVKLLIARPLICFSTGTTVLSYVNLVCGSLRNSIPKSIVYCQVREAKRSLLDHFFTELGGKEVGVPTLIDQLIYCSL